MRRQEQEHMTEPDKTFYFFNLRWGTYTGISTLMAMAIIYPVTRYAAGLTIIGFGVFLGIEVFRDYSASLKGTSRRGQRKLVYKAVSNNAIDIALFNLAILVGLIIGLGL